MCQCLNMQVWSVQAGADSQNQEGQNVTICSGTEIWTDVLKQFETWIRWSCTTRPQVWALHFLTASTLTSGPSISWHYLLVFQRFIPCEREKKPYPIPLYWYVLVIVIPFSGYNLVIIIANKPGRRMGQLCQDVFKRFLGGSLCLAWPCVKGRGSSTYSEVLQVLAVRKH